MFYTHANKLGKAGYKSENTSKRLRVLMIQLKKSELYAILMMLLDFQESLSVVTDHQYVERVVLHIETAKLIQDDSKITSLFIQLQQEIRTRNQLL